MFTKFERKSSRETIKNSIVVDVGFGVGKVIAKFREKLEVNKNALILSAFENRLIAGLV